MSDVLTLERPNTPVAPAALIARPAVRRRRPGVVRRLWKHKPATIGGGFLCAMILLACFGALLAPVDPLKINPRATLMAPSLVHLMGTDQFEAARVVGAPAHRLVIQHIFPNALPPILILSSVAVAWAILTGASLSFLGLGPPQPTPEWGLDLSNGRNDLRVAWWISTFPGLAIALTVVGVNLLGDGLREALDPKLRHAGEG